MECQGNSSNIQIGIIPENPMWQGLIMVCDTCLYLGSKCASSYIGKNLFLDEFSRPKLEQQGVAELS